MQRRSKSFQRPVLALLSIWVLLAPSAQAAPAEEGEHQRQQLEALRSRIAGLREQMQEKSGEKTKLSVQLQETEEQIGRLARRLRVLDGRLERQRGRLDELRAERQQQVRSLEQQRTALARQVRAAYVMGRQERLKILLNQQDPATVSRVMVYYDYLSRARAAKMRAIRDQIAQLAATEAAIGDEERKLARLHAEQVSELAAMRQSQAQRQDVVAVLTRELNDQSRQLDRLQSDERELETLLSGIEQALVDIPVENPEQVDFAGLRGSLPWPSSGRIVKRFGAPKLGALVWDGVMISAPEGREVRAVHHGRVAFADWLRGFGLLLIVDHGDGYMTLYGHNQSLFKEAGDWVEVNEPIALVGSSGGREQAGVYFGIRYQGRPIDPAKWCRRASGGKVG
ncbi:MAG: peptidoglycan DD-metalloendopeptidase family protein [Chromatiaceae bacterium]|nr:peptidoglycan DD-metalloendopeptidase family protein [Gammaproteobacteria bacterium]MCP5305035.1 peptidoglycan DD-metalloendopeptidase family protein [Chromatiaceae bacterium]MCP5314994.1 peptidoglycan DD-metalloendopeptidase family protein [Chromatiaceae bacterium]